MGDHERPSFVILEYTKPARDGGSCPIDLSKATGWERQEILNVWLEAVRCSNLMAESGVHFSERLQDPEKRYGKEGDVGSLIMGGDLQPTFIANKFVVAATKLKHLVEGMRHRIAMEERSSAPERAKTGKVYEIDGFIMGVDE